MFVAELTWGDKLIADSTELSELTEPGQPIVLCLIRRRMGFVYTASNVDGCLAAFWGKRECFLDDMGCPGMAMPRQCLMLLGFIYWIISTSLDSNLIPKWWIEVSCSSPENARSLTLWDLARREVVHRGGSQNGMGGKLTDHGWQWSCLDFAVWSFNGNIIL